MIEVIPAIDIIGGRVVRLTQGDFERVTEYGDPLEMALMLEDHGMKRLHLVDLDGAREKRVVNHRVLERIATRTSLVIDAGGGIRSDEDIRIVFESGAIMVTGGSIAITEPLVFTGWLEAYGPERIILGADFREGRIAVSGWEEATRALLMDHLRDFSEKGVRKTICTDISRDGMMEGPSMEIYKKIKTEFPSLYLIASGGVGTLKDIEMLDKAGIDGVITGKAIFEGRVGLKELESYILKNS